LARAEGHRDHGSRVLQALGEDRRDLRQAEEGSGARGVPHGHRGGRSEQPEGVGRRRLRPQLAQAEHQGDSGRRLANATERGDPGMSVLIKGGRVITAADDYVGDVYVEGERISLIGESLDVAADRVVDASGKYVLPGCIDPHTHLDMPFGGTVTIDDVESGQTSAAFGGTTCHVDFIIQPHGATFAEAFDEWKSKAEGK